MKATWISGLVGLAVLAACAEPEIVLPGKREPIDSVLAGGVQEDADPTNESRAIRLAAQSSNANWTHRPVSPGTRTAHPALGTALQMIWSTDIGDGDSRKHRITADPVVADGRVFTMDSKALVSAVSTAGAQLWSSDLTPSTDRDGDAGGGGLAYGDGKLFVTSGFGKVAALDPASGGVLWEQELGGAATGTPSYFGGLVYVVSADSTAWAIEADSGRVRWQVSSFDDVNNVFGGPAPAVNDKLVVFGFGSGEVQGVFRKGGLNIWNSTVVGSRDGRAMSTIGDITGDPVISGNTVYVANHSGRLSALNVDSGDAIWTAREGVVNPVWPAGDSVFGITDLGDLARFDAANGDRIWGVTLPGFTKERVRRRAEVYAHHGPILAGGRLIVVSNDGLIREFDPKDGSLIRTTEVPGGATTNPVVAGGTLYFVTTKGQLVAFR